MLGSRLKPLDHELQEPPEPDAHRAADPAQRDPLQQESCKQRALLLGDHVIFWIADKRPATLVAAVVLLPRMNVAVSLVPRGSTLGVTAQVGGSEFGKADIW